MASREKKHDRLNSAELKKARKNLSKHGATVIGASGVSVVRNLRDLMAMNEAANDRSNR